MNERIENLCLAAGLYAKLPNGNNYPVTMSAEEQCESLSKFAELIVFECVKIAVFKEDSATVRAIKEHFGVKE